MSKADLADLIARIEAADGPNFALFEAAFWAVMPNYADNRRFRELLDAEAWLDAAMTLVPEGAFWSITMRGVNRGGFHATVALREGGGLDWREAATPALALCVAALKAREADHVKG